MNASVSGVQTAGEAALNSASTAQADSSASALLTIDSVHKVYKTDLLRKHHVALEALSCQIQEGTCLGLLGHNGAGKTTTIRIILGLVRPDSGSVLFQGSPLSSRAKAAIGYMPEVNKLPSVLTPTEILAQQLRLSAPASLATASQRRAAVDETLASVGLAAHRNQQIRRLSKGMARRLAWAQAIVHRPALLILDEPASGLDPLGRQQMLGWIAAEKQRGATVLLCTHELNQVQTLCDEVLILNRGRTVYSSQDGKEVGRGAAWKWRYPYNVQLSGADAALLSRVQVKCRLPAWGGLKTEGFATTLGFANYEEAADWLKALLAEGLVVLRFGEPSAIADDALLRFFAKEA